MLVLNSTGKGDSLTALLSEKLGTKKIALGFDGYIDSIVRIVKAKRADGSQVYFEDSVEFGGYIIEKGDKNFSLELEQELFKVGGNMPITANAFARLGCKVDCVGALGLPDIHHIFQQMSANCTLYSYAEPGMSTAVEFRNNKMMMAESTQINNADWSYIRETIGISQLRAIFSDKDLIGLLNWSELAHSTGVWKGLLDEVLPFTTGKGPKPMGLFDLSDCSHKTHLQLLEALELLSGFSKYWEIVLSLNKNESALIYNTLMQNGKMVPGIADTAKAIFDAVGLHKVLVHHSTEACCCDLDGLSHRSTPKLANPRLLTGAGDNFNTGFCAALLLEMSTGEALEMGHWVTKHYITHGESPSLAQVLPH
jgi:sugar/nucleoside kinase (ribokinase family)